MGEAAELTPNVSLVVRSPSGLKDLASVYHRFGGGKTVARQYMLRGGGRLLSLYVAVIGRGVLCRFNPPTAPDTRRLWR